MTTATVGGSAWAGRADSETLLFTLKDLAQDGLVSKLQSIEVKYAAAASHGGLGVPSLTLD